MSLVESSQRGEASGGASQRSPIPPETSPEQTPSGRKLTQLPRELRLKLLREIVRRLERPKLDVLLVLLVPVTMAIPTGCSTGTAQVPVSTATIEPPIIDVPAAPLMREGLPSVCLWPSGEANEPARDYHCTEGPRPRDIIVPPGRWWPLRDHLDDWAEYPGLCRGAIDDCNRSWQAIVRGLAEVEAARMVEKEMAEDSGWSTPQAYFWIVTGSAVGIAVGFVFGAVVVATQ